MTQQPNTNSTNLDINIVNVVASVTLNQTFNLLDIVKIFRNVEYNPKRFPGLVYRLKRPKTATLIFSTGKMVCTGATSEKMARRAVNKVVRELKDNGIIILNKPVIVIQNMVASGNLHGAIDLETAADVLDNVMYEPEQFPGLIYRMQDPKTVLLLFASGKLVCTGAKSKEMVHESVARIYDVLQDYDLLYDEAESS
ncbi:TATA-box-binding protein [Candidatus Bathyarchaeota archaeon]|nr:TATA-box-binding protein [Candidatus Bathyarchaeota archaeon]